MLGLQGQQPLPVAHVLDVKGDWHLLEMNAAIAPGEALNAGARIIARSNRPGDSITIVHDDDMSRQRTVCDASTVNPCSKPLIVEGASSDQAPAQSQLKSMVQTALAILLNKPPAIASHYALTLSRGGESVREWEEVVSLDPIQGIVLPPAPEDMPAGQYAVSIAPGGDASSATEQPARLTSDGTWKPLQLRSTGLYEVSIMNSDGEIAADAILLVVPPESYEAMRTEFDMIKSRTATWTGPSAREDEHLFLRAFLLSECPKC